MQQNVHPFQTLSSQKLTFLSVQFF